MHLDLTEARKQLQNVLPALDTEICPLLQAQGRRLAQDIHARVSHPNLSESALDGIACWVSDSQNATAKQPAALKIVGESRAGQPFTGKLNSGECIRIYTGAPIPLSCTSHIHQEQATQTTQHTTTTQTTDALLGICPVEELEWQDEYALLKRPAFAKDIRHQGDDFRTGDLLLSQGQLLGPTQLALAASAGWHELQVYRRWRVGLLSTGDEVVPVGQPLQAGQVYDSNHVGLWALLEQSGCEIIDLGHAPDHPEQLAEQLSISQPIPQSQASAQSSTQPLDFILSSGGVSMGKYDFLRQLLFEQGEVIFWKVNIRPGGPALLGRWNGLPVIGLPGNPVSSLVVFQVLVNPVLQGQNTLPTLRLKTTQELRSLPNKTAFWRGNINGSWVTQARSQGSGMLSVLGHSNALIIVPAGQQIQAGDEVDVMVLDTLS